MQHLIDVIGIEADGFVRPELHERVLHADFLAGGERHLEMFPSVRAERFAIKNNLSELTSELSARCQTQRCVVLASGDPLFYGIAGHLLKSFGPNVQIEPARSSMQLAFARAGISWQSAALGSIHGRDLRRQLLPLLGRPSIGLFTQDEQSASALAGFFQSFAAPRYSAVVCENLGRTDERILRFDDLASMANKSFAPLHYLILQRSQYYLPAEELEQYRLLVPGVPDDAFARPTLAPEVMTRQEVRSVVLGKLGMAVQPGEVAWDVGAGLGTVAVELAVLRPGLEVVAFEKDHDRAVYLQQNRQRFDAINVRIVHGTAPEILEAEAANPRLVFLGGSGGNLARILDCLSKRLLPGGRLTANFVTLENLMTAVNHLKEWNWPFEVSEVHVARSDKLAGQTGLKPQRGVFIVSANKVE